uniref:Uncharacterized protein n=1 Tax=Lygus hesperus TaxID=30085 RepID=A0A0A9XGV0_LYGHE
MQLQVNKSQHDAKGNKLRPARLRTPAERLSYYYAGFMSSDLLCILPGNTSRILERALENYHETLPVQTVEVITNLRQHELDNDSDMEEEVSSVLQDETNEGDDSKPRRRSMSVAALGGGASGERRSTTRGSLAPTRRSSVASNLRELENDAFANENFDRVNPNLAGAGKNGKQAHGYEIIRRQIEKAMCPKPNPNLDLHDERTLVTICAEENFLLFLSLVILGSAVKNLMQGQGGVDGDGEGGDREHNRDGTVNVNLPISGYTVLTITETLYGPESLLHQLFKREVLNIDSEDGMLRWSRPSLYLRGAWTSRM